MTDANGGPVAHGDMSDANFPRGADGRSYHVGSRAGEVANRILIVGSASRAERIAKGLDKVCHVRASDRGFCVRTGVHKCVWRHVLFLFFFFFFFFFFFPFFFFFFFF
jgi:hypothetical protein